MRRAARATPEAELSPLETWRSWLFFGSRDVWKLKKPIAASPGAAGAATDTTTLEGRRAACEEEFRCNSALAPDVYLGVVPVVLDEAGGRLFTRREARPPRGATVVDWALHMARLPEDERADRLLEAQRLDDLRIRAIAHEVARFHESAERLPAPPDATAPVLELVGLGIGGDALPPEALRAEQLQREWVAQHPDVFALRAGAGAVRDGHGELGLEHVFVDADTVVRLIDRIEYDARLRRVDVCADVALLAADIAAAGRADLAERLLAEYAGESNDFDLYRVVDFYTSLRASTRGRIEWQRARHTGMQGGADGERRAEAHRARARRYLLMALAAPRRALLPPVVVALGGQVASGKSTLARALGRDIGAPVISSDRTRDYLLGARLNPELHELHWERAFDPHFLDRTYDEVIRRAGAVLASGRPVVLDGCFRSAPQRARARQLAASFGHPFFFVEASVPERVQHERLRERARNEGRPDSDWLEIAAELHRDWQRPDEIDAGHVVQVDTSVPLDQSVATLRARLPTWPERLTG